MRDREDEMSAATLMIQGTSSSVGKSLIVAALCRIFRNRGLRVAPFKSQNMALNSFVTLDGFEIGRAQAVQAEAARIEPAVEMNPILLKPEAGGRSQVVVMGKPVGSMRWDEYRAMIPSLGATVAGCLEKLRAACDLVVIEGAGSPAEINLRSSDIVNMHVARIAGAPVILAGDIDRGGVFAHFVGTMELLAPDERARVAGFLINKFRGDPTLLKPGLDYLRQRCGKPVLGIIPFIERLRIADEDSVALETRSTRASSDLSRIQVAVVKLPTISNYDDVLALEHEPGTAVRFVARAEEIAGADLVIIPGSKSTIADLAWMRAHGLASAITEHERAGGCILGICGGCQMLGETIEDLLGVESPEGIANGLWLLPLRTRYEAEKRTTRVVARIASRSFLGEDGGAEAAGYEIHMGRTEPIGSARSAFTIVSENGKPCVREDGAIAESGRVAGTMIHGVLDNAALRTALIASLARRRGIAASINRDPIAERGAEYDRLASAVAENADIGAIARIAGI